MISVCRWWLNPDTKNKNKFISRTLGKIAFIDSDSELCQGRLNSGEFWLSSIKIEVWPGQNKGCFLVEPFEKVEMENLISLNQTNCTISTIQDNKIVVVDPVTTTTPDGKFIPWILPLKFKSLLQNQKTVVATVVNLGGEMWKTVPSEDSSIF